MRMSGSRQLALLCLFLVATDLLFFGVDGHVPGGDSTKDEDEKVWVTQYVVTCPVRHRQE